jgi:phosphoribosylamine--glycine ligase
MKVLVVGGGGREHALVWKLARSPMVKRILAAPGNAGISRLAGTVPIPAHDVEGLARLAEDQECDLTVVGPEVPLTLGVVDLFMERGLAVFGPTRAGAMIEGSKWFAKELMREAGVPTAEAQVSTDREQAVSAARDLGFPVVIKADGLAAGKGVVVARDQAEAAAAIDAALLDGRFGDSGRRVVIEEYLQGEEVSILAFTDGTRFACLLPSQDHKRALDGDLGPNTGGMGAYAPAPFVTGEMLGTIEQRIIGPTLDAMREARGIDYRGVLYAGLMLTDAGPKVVEFNCRFGDPEAQVTLPLLDGDLAAIMLSVVRGELDPRSVAHRPGHAACVVMASGGYPDKYEKGKVIDGLPDAEVMEGVTVFHAGTDFRDGRLVTSGGRVLGVTARNGSLGDAVARAYRAVGAITFDGEQHRSDIGHRALRRLIA